MVDKCPECGTPVGGKYGADPYKHALTCLHVNPGPVDRILAEAEHAGNPERLERLKALLAGKKGGE